MDIGIALDGEGRLGRPAAVTAIARAADGLGYRSVWCIGPWAATLVGAVAVVTARVRVGLETGSTEAVERARAVAGGRLVVSDRLPRWPPGAAVRSRAEGDGSAAYRLDVGVDEIAIAADQLRSARCTTGGEVVVRLIGDPDVDTALAAYAELGELVDGETSPRS